MLLDNEAVQALRDPAHRKHRRALSEAELAFKRAVRTLRVRVAVPAAVRAAQNEQVLVITSDPGDMQRVAEGRQVNGVAL